MEGAGKLIDDDDMREAMQEKGLGKCDGLIAPWVIDAPMNRAIFETYIETQLAPALNAGEYLSQPVRTFLGSQMFVSFQFSVLIR